MRRSILKCSNQTAQYSSKFDGVPMRNFLVVEDLTPQEIEGVFSISQDLETKYKAGVRDALFPGRVLALVFEKQSLRTRVSFQTAMVHLGRLGPFPRGRHRICNNSRKH